MARWGFTAAPLGIDSLAIVDSLPRYWGFTSSPLGIHLSRDPLTNVCV
ncbi:MAG: hypothetical protein II570_03855 [Bacteroidaceae bacterium]|nr:hypothetical protein [Bacteroidaceae bacterium]